MSTARTLIACDRSEGRGLLTGRRYAASCPRPRWSARVRACSPTSLPPGAASCLGRGVRSASPERRDSQRRHSVRASRSVTRPVADHPPSRPRVPVRGHSPRRPAPARLSGVLRVEHGVVLDQPGLDAVLDPRSGLRRSGPARSWKRLHDSNPCSQPVSRHTPSRSRRVGEGLRAPVLQREIVAARRAWAPGPSGPETLAGAERPATARRPETPHAAPEEPRPARNTCRLVRSVLLDLITVLAELVCERSTVMSAKLPS